MKKALPEGTLCPIRVPALTFINTHPDFFWLTNYFETLISTTLCIPAIAGLEEYYKEQEDKSCLQTVFEDGKLVKEWSLRQIRDNVNNSIVLED